MEKRGKGKEIALLVLALALVGVLVYTFVPKNPPAPVTQKPTTDSAAASGTDKATVAAAKPALPTPEKLLKGSPGNSPNRNPFTAPPAAAPEPPTATARPQTARMAPAGPARPGLPDISGALGQMTALFPPVNAGPPAAPPEELKLTGVIVGRPSVAVFRKGDARYFARVGDQLGSEYVVTGIARGQVMLRSKEGKRTSLQLGGGVRA